MPLSHDEALLLVFHAELAAQPTTRHEWADPPERRFVAIDSWAQSCCDDASGKDRSELEPSPNERPVGPLTRSC